MICLENVSKRFKRGAETVRALDDVSLTVAQGQLALLCGPSGGGKSTLINLCAGLATPDGGSVIVAGGTVHAMSQRERAAMRARDVSVVFQMFHLTPYLSAFENIMLPSLTGHVPDARPRALMLMEKLRISHRANHRPGEMSAGERQRCALARALLSRPKVVLADEPTGNLDDESAAIALAVLDDCRKEGATVVLVSHQPVDAIKPDAALRLENGRLSAVF